MFATQLEARCVVIEGNISPGAGGMAGPTIRAKLTVMCIPGRVAGKAIFRRARKAICVTTLAVDTCMLTSQCKARSPVIEIYIRPTARIMTSSTVLTKLTIVLVVLLMT